MEVIDKFEGFRVNNQLFNAGDHVLLAVSGGKDSVLMVKLFKLAGFRFSIAHCNFNLRGAEAQRDEAFVKMLAEEMEVPFHVTHFDTKEYANAENVSIQMAARKLRYDWFESLRLKHNYQYIALAQHQNDAIETLLLNLVRGTGISGMHGILAKRGFLIRPLLFLSREQIEEQIEKLNLSFVEDSSNASNKYARNKIRLDVIPHLKELNPSLEDTFMQNIARFAETETLLQQMVAKEKERLLKPSGAGFEMVIAEVKVLQSAKLLMYEILKDFQFTAPVIDDLLTSLNKQSGTSFYSATHRLTVDRDKLILSEIEDDNSSFKYFHGSGRINWNNDQDINLRFADTLNFTANKQVAYVDADLLIFPLVVRSWLVADRFKPLGMNGFKKISDFFVDSKIPLPQKEKIPLIINGNGDLIWVAGLRQDERFKVTATTKKVAIFELLN